jgi:predicted pyridoxine 5'-phosphate oxidase superfamily flavin-nucleotide-binding protein
VRTIGLLSDHAPDEIPASHHDLAQCPPVAALTTVTRDGYPQTSVVWCDFDGQCVPVNTMRGFAKERNMRRNPRVTLLCYDPHRPLRYLEVRSYPAYYGYVYPEAQRRRETRVICRIHPRRVTLDAIHIADH